MRSITPRASTPATEQSSSGDNKEENSVKDTRKMWESRASTGNIGTKLKKATFGTAKTMVDGTKSATKTVVGGTIGATKTVAKGTFGAGKTVAKGTFGATKTVVGGTIGGTKKVAGATFGATKTAGKSARQAIEDVALFASPRVVQQKLNIGKKKLVVPSAFEKNGDEKKEQEKRPSKTPTSVPKAAGFEAFKEGGEKKQEQRPSKTITAVPKAAGFAAFKEGGEKKVTTPTAAAAKPPAPKGPKNMTIADRARAYEAAMNERAKKFDIVPGAPGAAPMKMRGKRTSRLDKFSPLPGRRMHEAKKHSNFPIAPFGQSQQQQQQQQPEKAKSDTDEPTTTDPTEATLSPTTVGSSVTEDDAAPAAAEPTTAEEPATVEKEAEPVTPEPEAPTEEAEAEAEAENGDEVMEVPVLSESEAKRESARASKKGSSKIDRDTIILQEIVEIIRTAEETEIYDEIDDETIEILKESALKSKAYTKRWYDAYTDSFIHCPSLAQTIVDYTLLELAEAKFQELYEEDFPMLYTVGLRGVACNMVGDEEEIPDYIYDMAM